MIAWLALLGIACNGDPAQDSAASTPDTSPPADTGETGPDDTSPGDDTGDTELFSELSLSLSDEIPAVVIATWRVAAGTPNDAGLNAARFGAGDETLGQSAAEQQSDGSWRAVLVGAPPETEVWVEPVHDEQLGQPATITTGGTPYGWIADPAVQGEGHGFVLTQLREATGAQIEPAILNADGRPVWWHRYTGDRELYGSRLWRSADGQRMYYNVFQIDFDAPDGFNGVISVGLDGSDVVEISLPTSHHDFWLHDDGSIAYLAYDTREIDGVRVMGDALVRWMPDGSEAVIWSIWDDLTFPGSPTVDTLWSQANAIEYVAADDAYLVGFRNLDSIFKIDAASGERIWSLGQEDPSFSLADPFEGQHGFEVTSDGLLLFDNHDSTQTSRAIRYALDGGEAAAAWSYTPSPARYTDYFGDLIDEGDSVLISWGHASVLERVTLDGEVTWSLTWGDDSTVGFIRHLDAIVE